MTILIHVESQMSPYLYMGYSPVTIREIRIIPGQIGYDWDFPASATLIFFSMLSWFSACSPFLSIRLRPAVDGL